MSSTFRFQTLHRCRSSFKKMLAALTAVACFGLLSHPVRAVDEAPRPAAPQGPRLEFVGLPKLVPNGHFRVSVHVGGKWQVAGKLPADTTFRTQTLDLSKWATGQPLRVRVENVGGANAHLDSVLINGQGPQAMSYGPLAKLAKHDSDLLRVFGKPMELTFAAPASGKAVLEVTGRIKGTHYPHEPFKLPLANLFKPLTPESPFYSYTLNGNRGALTPDGDLDKEKLGKPFFREFYPNGSSHPQAPIYGWVMNDDQNLYVALDFALGNTEDVEDNYGTVAVKTPQGIKEFKVREGQTKWGRSAFTYTRQASYEHQAFEFAIPLKELGIEIAKAAGSAIQLAIVVYGTGSPIVAFSALETTGTVNGVVPDTGPAGTTFTFIVHYNGSGGGPPVKQNLLIDLNGNSVLGSTVKSLSPRDKGLWAGSMALVAGLLVLVAARTMRSRWRPAFGGLATGSALTLIVLGCNLGGSSSDSGGVGALCTEPSSETISMTHVGTGINWDSLGEDFTTTVKLCGARTLTWKFDFTNSTLNPLTGPASGTYSLTVAP